jgi:16S rRNA processing protein RimM
MRATSFSPAAPNLQVGARVYLGGSDTPQRIVRARAIKGGWTIEIAGIASPEAVQPLIGTLIEAADDDVRRDDADSYFVHELIGLRVVTDEGVELGHLTEVLQMGAADVYVIQGPQGEILLPAIADVIREIDTVKQFMRITLLPGMLDNSK